MTLTLMQKGTGAARPLVAAFGPLDPGKLPAKLGPGPCIVVDSDGHGTESMVQVVDFAAQKSGATSFSATALIGFSIGCSRVRALRLGGAIPGAYLLMDGTHASWPPQPWQIQWIRDIADQARAGKILVVASHTYQTYTEKIVPTASIQPFASTVSSAHCPHRIQRLTSRCSRVSPSVSSASHGGRGDTLEVNMSRTIAALIGLMACFGAACGGQPAAAPAAE